MCHHSNRQPNKQSHPAFLSNMIRYGADEGPGSMLAILSQGASSHVCVSVSNRPEWGFRGRWEWMRNVRKPKKGKEWRQKSKEVVYAHRTKMERGVFFIIGLFLRVPDSLAERRRQGDRDVYEVSLSLSLQHTHTFSHTHTHTHTHTDRKDGPDCGGLQEHIMRVWDRGDVETSINHHRLITVATALLLAGHIIPKQNTHTITPKAPHTHKSLTKTSDTTHTHTHTNTHTHSSLLQHMWTSEQVGPGPWSSLWVAVFYIRQAWPSCTI